MYWSVILLKYSIAGGVVGALRDREDKVLQQLEVGYTLAFTDFTAKGQKAPRFPPKKTAPDHHRNPFALFFQCYALSFPFFKRCSEYPDLVCII